MFGPNATNWKDGNLIKPGENRVVVSGGWAHSTRHVSLCLECAEREASKLLDLARQIISAINKQRPTVLF